MFGLFSPSRSVRNQQNLRGLRRCLLHAERFESKVLSEVQSLENRAVDQAKSGQPERARSTARTIQRMLRTRMAAERRVDKLRYWVSSAGLAQDDSQLAEVLGRVAADMKVPINKLPDAIDAFGEAIDNLNAQEDVWQEADQLDEAGSSAAVDGVPTQEAILSNILARAGVEPPAAPAQREQPATAAPLQLQLASGTAGAAADETSSLRERARRVIESRED